MSNPWKYLISLLIGLALLVLGYAFVSQQVANERSPQIPPFDATQQPQP